MRLSGPTAFVLRGREVGPWSAMAASQAMDQGLLCGPTGRHGFQVGLDRRIGGAGGRLLLFRGTLRPHRQEQASAPGQAEGS